MNRRQSISTPLPVPPGSEDDSFSDLEIIESDNDNVTWFARD